MIPRNEELSAAPQPVRKVAARALRQGPSTQAEFSLRERSEGFSRSCDPETIELIASETVVRSKPVHFSIQDGVADPAAEQRRRFAERGGDYPAGPLLVSRLPSALVDTSRFVICPDEQRYLLDSFRHPLALIRWGYTHVEGDVYERERDEVIEEREERVVVLGAQANRNYSHWLVESMARALLFTSFDDGSVMYLCPRLEPWQHEALILAGVEEEAHPDDPRRRLVRFREVFAVSRGFSRMPALIPGAISALAALAEPAALAMRAARTKRAAPNRRLFVSRALVERRHISNEAQLAEVLVGHGFRRCTPSSSPCASRSSCSPVPRRSSAAGDLQ